MSFQSKLLQASGSVRKIRERLLVPQQDGTSNGAEDGSHGRLQGKFAGGGLDCGCCVRSLKVKGSFVVMENGIISP